MRSKQRFGYVSRKGAVYIEITRNILSSIKADRLYRIDVDFVIAEK